MTVTTDERQWLGAYPEGIPAEIDLDRYFKGGFKS